MNTEESKIDKRTKEYKATRSQLDESKIVSLIESGIPIIMAVFHSTVRSIHEGIPETAFFDPEFRPAPKPSKAAQMWYTPHGLVCLQKGRYKILPLAQVADTIVK